MRIKPKIGIIGYDYMDGRDELPRIFSATDADGIEFLASHRVTFTVMTMGLSRFRGKTGETPPYRIDIVDENWFENPTDTSGVFAALTGRRPKEIASARMDRGRAILRRDGECALIVTNKSVDFVGISEAPTFEEVFLRWEVYNEPLPGFEFGKTTFYENERFSIYVIRSRENAMELLGRRDHSEDDREEIVRMAHSLDYLNDADLKKIGFVKPPRYRKEKILRDRAF